ncbi:MAG: DUF2333 family protein [Spongiibacteraceae bacterium]
MKWRGLSQRAEHLSQRAEQWSEELREEAREHVGDTRHWRIALAAAGAFAITLMGLGIYWSREPAQFDVSNSVNNALHETAPATVEGALTTATLQQVVVTLLDKPGGFINNDIFPPGLWLDNMPHWERGALQQARDMARSLRDDFGRASAQAELNDDLARAEPRLNFSESSWMLPASESQYRDAAGYLRDYLKSLEKRDDHAVFVTTAEVLDRYLARVTQRLDIDVQRLSACIEPRENPLRQRENSLSQRNLPTSSTSLTPSSQLDDVFYEARGSAWALSHLLRAIELDFSHTLREKNALLPMQEAIRALDAAQGPIYSPMILNGSGFGFVANHSLVMASYMARAEAAVANVRRLLSESIPAQNTSVDNTQEINP